jgi:glycosyltransferase involved in cell wall biosynthesis
VDRVDEAYFGAVIRPLLDDPRVEFIGEIGEDRKQAFLGNARALLFSIDWPEPFGLVLIEAMACGTPVIAWRRGAVPEIVEEGLTGFVVDSVDEAVAAVDAVGSLPRHAARRRFEERFTARRMAEDYLRVYEAVAQPRAPTLPARTRNIAANLNKLSSPPQKRGPRVTARILAALGSRLRGNDRKLAEP